MTVGTDGGTIKVDFEWDEQKRLTISQDRHLDFRDAVQLFDGRNVYGYASNRHDESRWVNVGFIYQRLISVVWVEREGTIRIISMRRAWNAEEKVYRALYDKTTG